MNLKTIRLILIIGVIWISTASLLEILIQHQASSKFFLIISFIGQCVFLCGLFLLDKKAKSILSRYYGAMILTYLVLQFAFYNKSEYYVLLCLIAFFFIVLFKYLQIFTRISGISLFINSFYILLICVFIGLIMLKFTHIVEHRAIISFILGFMIFPPLIIYIGAIFLLKNITFDTIHKTIV